MEVCEAFASLEAELSGMRARIEAAEPADIHEEVNALSKKFGDVEGASKIKSAISKARRDLKAKKPKKDRALKSIDKAVELYAEQQKWRAGAATALSGGLAEYKSVVRDTIGIRSQPKMSREQALFVAGCQSHHRDISLNF